MAGHRPNNAPQPTDARRRWGNVTRVAARPQPQTAGPIPYPDQSQFAGYTMEDWDDTRPDSDYKDAGTTGLAIPPHGPASLLNTPGVSTPKFRKRRTKAPNYSARAGQVIAGNLARGGDGKFTSAGNADAAKPAAKKPADRTARRAERAARQDAERATREEEIATEAATREEEDAYIADGATGKERQARRREIAAARRERAAARRQARAERQTAERERRAAEDAEDAEATTAEADEKPKGGGGGGGEKPKPTDDEKRAAARAERQQRAVQTAAQLGQDASFIAGLTAAVEGNLDGSPTPRLSALGFVENGEATDAARRALNALERGDVRGYRAAVQDAQARMQRSATQTQARTEREQATAARRAATEARRTQQLDLLAQRARQGSRLTESQRDQLTLAGRAEQTANGWRVKAGLQVFKDARGRDRWVAVSSTAYRDRDDEIVSTAALKAVVARGDATGERGPLRYWHVPGVELGDCDYQALAANGRLLIESGTFRHPAIAHALKARAQDWQMSIGFDYPDATQPDADGVFSDIAVFERSIVPPGRASNVFTRFAAKEISMSLPDDKTQLLAELLGGTDTEAYKAAVAGIAQTEKAASASGVAYKDAPAWAQALVTDVQALGARLKALETKAPMPADEMIEAGDTEMRDGEAELTDDLDTEEPAAEFLGDMAVADFRALLTEALASAIATFGSDIGTKLAEMDNALKGMGYARAKSDDGLAALTTAQQALDTRLKALEGDQPRSLGAGVMRQLGGLQLTTEQARALKQSPDTTGATPPATLNAAEAAAYTLLFGNE